MNYTLKNSPTRDLREDQSPGRERNRRSITQIISILGPALTRPKGCRAGLRRELQSRRAPWRIHPGQGEGRP